MNKQELAELILNKHQPQFEVYQQTVAHKQSLLAAIVEAMDAPAQKGMKWVQAFERLPEIGKEVFWNRHEEPPAFGKYSQCGNSHYLVTIDCSGEEEAEPINYDWEWLDESAPAKEVEAISDSKEPKKTLVISAFPSTGKSYLSKLVNSLDSDSSSFSWLPNTKIRNGQFPFNYIQNIKRNLGKYDFIFVSSHKEVRTCMIQYGIDFLSVYPDKSLKEEYLQRYKDRGNDLAFIEMMDKNWDSFIDGMGDLQCMKPLILKSGEYLADYFLLNNDIKEATKEAISDSQKMDNNEILEQVKDFLIEKNFMPKFKKWVEIQGYEDNEEYDLKEWAGILERGS
jgi:hypothetical protein